MPETTKSSGDAIMVKMLEVCLEAISATVGAFMAVTVIIVLIGSISTHPVDATDIDAGHRSGMRILTDSETGLQYLSGMFWITPRMSADGKQMREIP